MSRNVRQCISLQTVLQANNAPLDEVQAWSMCYQILKSCGMFDAFKSSTLMLKTVKTPNVDNVSILSNGDVECGDESEFIKFTESETITWLNLVGGIIYNSLDFGLTDGEERELSDGVCQLIETLTGATPERDDEGIEGDEENSVCGSIVRLQQMCEAVSEDRGQSPGSHHAAVCRAMYWHVRELQEFLNGVGDVEACSEEERRLRELNRQVWVTLWSQVMEDLRRGVRLRAVKNSEQLPSQQRLFELTPYEMLMEDIRLRRYKLRRMERTSVPGYLRASAHEMILEYIRSRPPLKPAERRVLPRPRRRSPTPRDRTLEMIRNKDFTLRIVDRPVENRCALPRRRRRRRVIKPDFNLDDLSDEDEAFPELWQLVSESRDTVDRAPAPPPSMEDLRGSIRRRITPIRTPEITALRRASSFASYSTSDLRREVCVRRLNEKRRESDVGSFSAQLSRRSFHQDMLRQDSDEDFSDISLPSPQLSRAHRLSLESCRSRSPALDNDEERAEEPPESPRRYSLDAKLSSGGLTRGRPRGIRDSGFDSVRSSVHMEEEEERDDGDLSGSSSVLRPRSISSSVQSLSGSGDSIPNHHNSDLSEVSSPFRRQTGVGRRSVRLNLAEVSLIRSTLARAELETVSSDKKLYDKIRRERVCFACRKTEFGFLRWGKRCNLCQQMVCADCRTKTNLPSNRSAPIGDFLVNSLAPADGPPCQVIDSIGGQSPTSSKESPSRGLRRHQSFIGSTTPVGASEVSIVCKRCACVGYITKAH